MSYDIRGECFQRIQEPEFAWFDHCPTGWLISRLTSDCDKLARIIAWGTLVAFIFYAGQCFNPVNQIA